MKKVQILVAILCFVSITTRAQIKVDTYGDVHVGSTTITPYDTQGDLIIGQDGLNNSLTFYSGVGDGFRIYRGIANSGKFGYITRGTTTWYGLVMDNTGKIGIRKEPDGAFDLDVLTNIRANTWTSSDKKVKTNIHGFTVTKTVYDSLQPYKYAYKKRINVQATDTTLFRTVITDTAESRESYGFIAQDVQKYFPELVMQGTDSLLSIYYDGFIPILWKSNAELRHTISTLEERISQLERENGNGHLKSETTIEQQKTTTLQTTVLHQNFPNPWNTSTEITMELDRNIRNAILCIYDMTGKQIKCYTITSRGNTQVTIHAEELQAGMYMYSLIADGILIDTKKMVLTNK